MTKGKLYVLSLLFGLTLGLSAYYVGRHHKEPTVKWYSDMTSQLQGHKIYLIDTPVMCPNRQVRLATGQMQMVPGKEIGKLQIDINLQNGDLRVVTNTVPAWLTCDK